jgi:glycosyltransferase involved in cell wall biosynthesis
MDNSQPHLILVCYYFPPEQEIGGFRPFRFYKYLKRKGYQCHVITAAQPSRERSDDVIHVPDDHGAIWERHTQKPLSVLGYLELLIRKFFFPGKLGIMWSLKIAARCRKIIRAHPQQRFVILTSFPPLGVLLAGLIIRWREKQLWICDWRDPIDVDALHNNSSRLTLFLNRRLERWAFRDASAVIANVESAAAIWRSRYPQATEKIQVIYNGFDPDDALRARVIPPVPDKAILHAGQLYMGRNPNPIIASLIRLRRQQVPEVASVCLHQLGGFGYNSGLDSTAVNEAKREGLLKLMPQVSREDAQGMIAEAHGLLLLQPQSAIQVPGKLFEYICVGRPILALVPRLSAVEQILEKAGVPFVCVYSDEQAEDVDRKLVDFLRIPSEAAEYSDWFHKNFNAEYQTCQLSCIIDNLTRTERPLFPPR